jgi:hypothetical protein
MNCAPKQNLEEFFGFKDNRNQLLEKLKEARF